MTKAGLLKILEDEIAGDGQGYPDQSERVAAMNRIWPEIERLRAALDKIASYEIKDDLNYYNARAMIETAREALKE